jgi:glycosyltransferase involved in cell wall biosynthesis
LATVSPFPAAVVARRVAAFKKLPWVLDMRDPWALDPITFYPTRLHYKYQLKKMAAAAHAATSVIMNTPASLTALRKAFPSLPKEKLFCITNGWDSADFTSLSSCVSGKEINSPALTIVHIGQFHTQYAVNVDCARRKELLSERKRMSDWFRFSSDTPDLLCRSPYYLFAALRQLLDTNTIAPGDVRCIFIGAQSTADTCLVDRFSLEGMVEFTGYLDHTSCLKKMEQADVLMLPLHKPASGSDPLIVPGKAYEYMASGKPIWGLVPQGDCRNLLLRAGVGVVSEPDDVEGIAQRIAGFIKEKRDGRALQMQPNREYIDSFERSVLTARLAEVLDYSIKAHAN